MASALGCAPRGVDLSSPGAAEKAGSGSVADGRLTDQRYPGSCRLTARTQFLKVYEHGRRVGSPSFILFGLPNDVGHCRLGVTVTRKIGGAVVRNKIKRRLREVFRKHRGELAPALDLVVNAKHPIKHRTTAELEAEFLQRFAAMAGRFER